MTAVLLHNLAWDFIIGLMTEKEIVLETIRALPDDCSLEEIAERVEFMAAVQKGPINSTEAKAFLTTK